MQNKLKSPNNQSQNSGIAKPTIINANIMGIRQGGLSYRNDRDGIIGGPINSQQQISSQSMGQTSGGLGSNMQTKVKKVIAFNVNQNFNQTTGHHSSQTLQVNNANHQISQGSSGSGSQQQRGKKQEVSPNQKKVTQVTNRYESLQNKLKNKRRQTASNSQSQVMNQINLSTTQNHGQVTQAAYNKQSQQLQDSKQQTSQNQVLGKFIQNSSGTNLTTQRKHLKLSIDNNSDASYNNITIKSADKNKSVMKNIPSSTKGGSINLSSHNQKEAAVANNIISPSSSSSYQSHFQVNSRFNNARPKNPTEQSSSLSSKNSDQSIGKFIPTLDLKKIQLQKFVKQSAVQAVKEQHQINQINHEINQHQIYSEERKIEKFSEVEFQTLQTQASKELAPPSQISTNSIKSFNSTQPLNKADKISAQSTQQQVQQQQNKQSKFTLVSKPIDLGVSGGVQTTKEKNKKSFQFQNANQNFQAPQESFRKNSLLGSTGQLKLSTQQIQQQSMNQNSGVFSPKQHSTNQSNLAINKTQKLALSGHKTQNQKTFDNDMQSQSLQQQQFQLIKNINEAQLQSQNQQDQLNNNQQLVQQILQNQENFNEYKQSQYKQTQVQGYIHNEYQLMKNHTKQTPRINEAIMEENQEESAQNTKRDSVASHLQEGKQRTQKSSQIMVNEQVVAQQEPIKQSQTNKNSSINLNQQQLQQQQQQQQPNKEYVQKEEKKAAQNIQLQALKDQLKAQILKTQHITSNPQQPSSQIEVDEIQYPITSQKALKLFYNNLSDYEKSEILDFKEIYFLGLNAQKIKGTPLLPHNFGFDDERGDYNVIVRDQLAYRYEVLEFLGKGSFGQALKCYDYKTNSFVAIKIIRNKKRFYHQAGVELKILMYLKEHDPEDVNNIIRMKDYHVFRKHLIISFELLSINLYEFIKNNNFQGVSLGLIRRFAIQILQALKYQKDHNVVHCDLKPENILLKQTNKSGIKIIDYGSSCFQNERIYTYIQSRFYRAPEIVLGIPYSTAIDMWSFGCIMAELYTGFPLFPGENEMEQLAYIMEIQGVPPEYILEIASRKKLFFDNNNEPIIVANSRGKKRKPLTKTLQGVLRCNEQSFLSFVSQCLNWDPLKRMTPLEALQHEWILEGLPPKVLLHHQRMFGMPDDKTQVQIATNSQIQGFPQNQTQQNLFVQQQQITQHVTNQQQEDTQAQIVSQKRKQSVQPQLEIQPQQQQVEPKKNKTIQLFMSELFEDKQQQQNNNHQTEELAPNQTINNQKQSYPVIQIEPQTFYGTTTVTQKNADVKQNQVKNQTMPLQKMKELDSQQQEQQVVEDDMEEGAHFSQTQKIPISLINKQEMTQNQEPKIVNKNKNSVQHPHTSGQGLKLNNYLSYATQSSKGSSIQPGSTTAGTKKSTVHGSFHKQNQSQPGGFDVQTQSKAGSNINNSKVMKTLQQQSSDLYQAQIKKGQKVGSNFKMMAQTKKDVTSQQDQQQNQSKIDISQQQTATILMQQQYYQSTQGTNNSNKNINN